MISFTYEYKLKLTKKQVKDIEMYLEVSRAVYNWNHRERKDWIQSRKTPNDLLSSLFLTSFLLNFDNLKGIKDTNEH